MSRFSNEEHAQSTSLEAYIAEQPRIQSQLERVKAFFHKYPSMRFTDSELQTLFKWKPNVVWSRRAQLVRNGWIVAAGFKVNPVTGHRVTAYQWNSSISEN